jgi:hypothetical protein
VLFATVSSFPKQENALWFFCMIIFARIPRYHWNTFEAQTLNWLKLRRWKVGDNYLDEVAGVGLSAEAACDSCYSSNVLRQRACKFYQLAQNKLCARGGPKSKVTQVFRTVCSVQQHCVWSWLTWHLFHIDWGWAQTYCSDVDKLITWSDKGFNRCGNYVEKYYESVPWLPCTVVVV